MRSQKRFNSTLVQLKDSTLVQLKEYKFCFNSTLVQLKEKLMLTDLLA